MCDGGKCQRANTVSAISTAPPAVAVVEVLAVQSADVDADAMVQFGVCSVESPRSDKPSGLLFAGPVSASPPTWRPRHGFADLAGVVAQVAGAYAGR